uniref:Dehydrogenase/reductase SDR family member 1 n=1 Tax=Ditylenchus dipsaci TaxID=166011 RepID=A0A915DW21_9BILA
MFFQIPSIKTVLSIKELLTSFANVFKSGPNHAFQTTSRSIALVTGASRGIGRGIALQLAEAGACVYMTGRRPSASLSANDPKLPTLEQTAQEIAKKGGESVVVFCDHANSEDVRSLFNKIEADNQGKLDILVNNAFSGASSMANNVGKKFYECAPEYLDEVNDVGLRNYYFCSVYAARMMAKKNNGLIVNVSSAGGLQYFFNVPYGVGKAAVDRLTADMGLELKESKVTVVSVWPGVVKTELGTNMHETDLIEKMTGLPQATLDTMWKTAETPEFVGKSVVGLACDKNKLKKSGRIWITADLASEYKFRDVNGLVPANMRSVKSTLLFLAGTDWQAGCLPLSNCLK